MVLTVTRKRLAYLLLFLILGVAATQIFFRLDTPSLWLDEIAAPLNARYPVAYLIDLSRRLEEHPPLFYLLTKLSMTLGESDFHLRLLPALCGLASTVMVFFLGRRMFGDVAGVLGAALFAANPHALWLARVARPYMPWLFLVTLSLFFLVRYLGSRSGRDLLALAAVNLVMMMTHYMSVIIIGSEVVFLALFEFIFRENKEVKPLIWFVLLTFLTISAVHFVFINGSHVAREVAGLTEPFSAVLETIFENIVLNFYYFDNAFLAATVGLLFLFGMYVLFREHRLYFYLFAVFVSFGLVMIIILQKAAGLYPRHFVWLSVFISLAAGAGLARVAAAPGRLASLTAGILAVSLFMSFVVHRDRYYELDSYRVPVIGDNYKTIAEFLRQRCGDGQLLHFSNEFFGNALTWYLGRTPADNIAERQVLAFEQDRVQMCFVSNVHFEYIAKDARDFLDKYRQVVETLNFDSAKIFVLDVQRSPLHVVDVLPMTANMPMYYTDFFRSVSRMENMRFYQDARSPSVIPTKNDRPGFVEYEFDNTAGDAAQCIVFNIYYDNLGTGNRIVFEYAFDDEEVRRVLVSQGIDAMRQGQVRLDRDRPYRRLRARVSMVCAGRTPLLLGGNLATLRFKGLDGMFCAAGEREDCTRLAMARFAESVLENYQTEEFIAESRLEQALAPVNTNVVEAPEPGVTDWSRFVAADARHPAILNVRVKDPGGLLRFYPRVGRGSRISVSASLPGESPESLFVIENTRHVWTPISARYEVPLPERFQGRTVDFVIELSGPWAQLWHHQNMIFN